MSVRRTGLTTITNLALKLCKLIGVSTPIIKRIYPDSTALHTALDVTNAACSVLVEEALAVLPEGD